MPCFVSAHRTHRCNYLFGSRNLWNLLKIEAIIGRVGREGDAWQISDSGVSLGEQVSHIDTESLSLVAMRGEVSVMADFWTIESTPPPIPARFSLGIARHDLRRMRITGCCPSHLLLALGSCCMLGTSYEAPAP